MITYKLYVTGVILKKVIAFDKNLISLIFIQIIILLTISKAPESIRELLLYYSNFAPHLPQNLSSASCLAPQLGQILESGFPQSAQKLFLTGFSAPQNGHFCVGSAFASLTASATALTAGFNSSPASLTTGTDSSFI